jgi:hypothetical protein
MRIQNLLISVTLTVKPDATQAEIKAAFDDQQGGQQIFSQAVSHVGRLLMVQRTDSPIHPDHSLFNHGNLEHVLLSLRCNLATKICARSRRLLLSSRK